MPLNCPQAVSKLKAYQQQHQKLQTIFDDLLSQAPYLPDVKWDEPFMSSPHYKDITNTPKDIFDNLYDAKEEARKKLEELKEKIGYQEPLTEKEFSQLTRNERYTYLSFRCHNTNHDPNRRFQYKKPIPDLKKYELEFLYDNCKIDRQLSEIITHRDQNADMLRILDCTPDQIIHNQQELRQAIKDKKEIKAYLGELFPNFFQILPQNIEYIYTKFPEGRIKKMEVTIGGQSKEELIEEMKSKFRVSEMADSMLKNADFTVSKEKENLTLIRLKVQDLGFLSRATTKEIFERVEELGIELCPAETGPQLCKQYLNHLMNEWLIGMKPITASGCGPGVFYLERHEDGLWLNNFWAFPGDLWNPDREFVFRLRKLEI